jgi:hypothetical protein
MKLTCKTCGTPIRVKNINLQTMVAGCDACNSVFPFTADDLSAESSKGTKIKTPPSFDIHHEDAETLDIEIDWRKAFGSLEWMFLVLMSLGALTMTPLSLVSWNAALTDPQGPLGPLIVGSIFSAIALFCWYVLAVFAFNRTRLTLTEDRFDYVHRPLYWQGKHLPTDSIVGIELTPTDQFSDYRGLVVVTDDGQRHFLDNFQIQHAQYLQRRLQRALFKPEAPTYDHLTAALDEGAEVQIGDDGELNVVRVHRSTKG